MFALLEDGSRTRWPCCPAGWRGEATPDTEAWCPATRSPSPRFPEQFPAVEGGGRHMSKSQNATSVPSAPSELDGPTTSLDGLAAELVSLREVEAKLAKLRNQRTKLQGKIKAALGKTEIGTVAGVQVVSFKYVRPIALDQQILKTNFPDIYEECLDVTEMRRFVLLKAS